MPRLRFSSILPSSYRDELERVVFFNGEQWKVEDSLVATVHRYGVPKVSEDGACLRFHVPAFAAIQSLYAMDEGAAPAQLAGVVMFVRPAIDTMLLLHLAVHEDYCAEGIHGQTLVAPRLIAAVRAICLHTRGISLLRMLYPRPGAFLVRPTPGSRHPHQSALDADGVEKKVTSVTEG